MFESLVEALDQLATQSKAQMKLKFLETETSVKSKLNQTFSTPNQRRCRMEPVLELEHGCIEEEQFRVDTTTKESTCRFAGSLEKMLQIFSNL